MGDIAYDEFRLFPKGDGKLLVSVYASALLVLPKIFWPGTQIGFSCAWLNLREIMELMECPVNDIELDFVDADTGGIRFYHKCFNEVSYFWVERSHYVTDRFNQNVGDSKGMDEINMPTLPASGKPPLCIKL